jgi:hypothetical protein
MTHEMGLEFGDGMVSGERREQGGMGYREWMVRCSVECPW